MNRRAVLGGLLLTPSLFESALAQKTAPQQLVELENITANWQHLEFVYEGVECVLQRVKAPTTPTARVLLHQSLAFCAVSRICTHAGCTTELPKSDGFHKCDCHFSVFTPTGESLSALTSKPLPALRLEVRQNAIWALGWL